MRTLMGVVKDRHGTYYARKKVPKTLEGAVAQIVGADKPRVSWLKKSLRTKDQKQSNIRAKAALMEFDRIIENARATLKPFPLKPSLSDHEITRIAAYHFASVLGEDEEHRQGDEDDTAGLHQRNDFALWFADTVEVAQDYCSQTLALNK